MALLDQAFLLATGLFALYLCVNFYRNYNKQKEIYNIYYLISFAVLLVAGLLLIFLTYDVLASPFIVIVSTLIPLTLALGLVTQFYPQQEKYFLIFVITGLFAIAATRFTGPSGLGTVILATVHSIAGLTIFFIPIISAKNNIASKDFIAVTVGGTLIGIGGIALAFLKVGKPLLFFTEDFIFMILAPLLLLMAASFAHGFIKGKVSTPPSDKGLSA